MICHRIGKLHGESSMKMLTMGVWLLESLKSKNPKEKTKLK